MKYYKYKIENLIKINKIVTVHYFEFENDFSFPSESHNFWELLYIDKNDFLYCLDGKENVLHQGEAVFFPPNVLHSVKANGKKANVIIVSFECKNEAVHFLDDKIFKVREENAKMLFSVIKESKRTFNLPYSDPLLKKMPLLEKPSLGGLQLIKNYLEIFLIELIRSENDKTENLFFFNKETGNISEQIINYLIENVDKQIKIDDLAKKLNYSKAYLFRCFKAQTGNTISAYHVNLKIEKSKTLLQKNYSITQIAYMLGFESQSYFTKTFKKITSMSPKQYKKIFCQK